MAKRNSPSDKRQRERTAANKARRIARAPKAKAFTTHRGGGRMSGEYGRPRQEWDKPRVTFTENIRARWEGAYIHALIVEGVVVEWSVNRADIDNAKRECFSRHAYQHVTISPYGNRTLVESRRAS